MQVYAEFKRPTEEDTFESLSDLYCLFALTFNIFVYRFKNQSNEINIINIFKECYQKKDIIKNLIM